MPVVPARNGAHLAANARPAPRPPETTSDESGRPPTRLRYARGRGRATSRARARRQWNERADDAHNELGGKRLDERQLNKR